MSSQTLLSVHVCCLLWFYLCSTSFCQWEVVISWGSFPLVYVGYVIVIVPTFRRLTHCLHLLHDWALLRWVRGASKQNCGQVVRGASKQKCGPERYLTIFFNFVICNFYFVLLPTNAQLFHRFSHSYMFRHYSVILKKLVINTLPSYTSISNAAVGNTIYS